MLNMKDYFDFTSIEEALGSAQTFAVILPKNLDQDKIAASLALGLALKKVNKDVQVICSTPMTVAYSSLVGVNRITNKLKGKNLVVSFDYTDDSIEKVSYNIDSDQNKFNLVIQPKEGRSPLSPENVKYSYLGANADMIFVIGANRLEEIGQLYFDNKKFFEEGQVVNLDINQNSQQFGKFNFIKPDLASYSEFIALMLATLKIAVDEDIASNLLLGMERATNNFSLDKATPTTFEAVAFCLRAGARRPLRKAQDFRPQQRPVKRDFNKRPFEQKQEERPVKPSPDWYKPKIYRGDTKI